MSRGAHHPPGWPERLYALLLRLYPAAVRRAHGAEMRQLVRDRGREPRHQGARGRLRLALHLARDVAATAPAERAAALLAALRARRERHASAFDDDRMEEPMATLLQDLRYAVRTLRARPGFTAIAVLTLALGIGANAAMFSVVNEMLLRPLPFHEPERMVTVFGVRDGDLGGVSIPDLEDFARAGRAFEALGVLSGQTVNHTGGTEPDRLRGGFVSGGFFAAAGARTAFGRLFTPDETRAGSEQALAVLGHHAWRTRFGGDSAILGRVLQLNGRPFQVVGVLSADFQSPFDRPDVYLPIVFHTSGGAGERDDRRAPALGRLQGGATLAEARAELAVIAERLAQQYPETNEGRGAHVEPVQHTLTKDARPAVLTVFAVVALVLLIVCANVANLLLARAAARRREMSLRAALGAGRRRLVRQLLTESLVLASAGGLLGVMVAYVGLQGLVSVLPSDFVLYRDLRIDGVVLLFALLLALGCGVLFGLAPALHASRTNLSAALVARGSAPGRPGRLTARNVFVVAQLALAIVLLVAAGLLTRSAVGLQAVEPGFDPEDVLTMEFRLPASRYDEDAEQSAFMVRAVAELRRVPGVRQAALVRAAPFSYNGGGEGYVVEGREPPPGTEAPYTQINSVTPGYFATMRIPLVAGRDLAEGDHAESPPVMVVSEELARRAWPDESPIGRRLRSAEGGPWFTVVGVVGNTKHYGLTDEIAPQAYVSFAQVAGIFATVVARVDGDPLALAPAVRDAIWAVDRDQPVWKIRTLEQMMATTLAPQRLTARLVGGFALLALLLAGMGIYGVMSFAVVQRTQEVGVRMALGAQRAQVVALVLRQGLALTLVSIALGVTGAWAGTRVLASQLHGVGPLDPLTFASVPLVLGVVALLATLVPAFRASRMDPVRALRYE